MPPCGSEEAAPPWDFSQHRSSGPTLEGKGLFLLRRGPAAGPSVGNSEEEAWPPCWEEARVVSRGEGRRNEQSRGAQPRGARKPTACRAKKRRGRTPASQGSLWGLGRPFLSPFTARRFSSARKGHCVQRQGPGRGSGTPPAARSGPVVPLRPHIPLQAAQGPWLQSILIRKLERGGDQGLLPVHLRKFNGPSCSHLIVSSL